ncbi:MAG: hypothetical protein H7293_16760 [Candidatus Saccharibacteria bacterium]|nr:hypothetical protein [Rhodoferax sp.]
MNLLETIARKTTDDAGCMVWSGACCNGHPAMKMPDGKTSLIRRLLWSELHGEIPAGHIVRMTCTTPRCVSDEHLELTTYKKLGKELGALGVMSGPVRSAAIARAKRKTHAKLSDEAVRDIRSSVEFGYILAERHGVSAGHVSKIQKHKAWREFSSPFAGLGARL